MTTSLAIIEDHRILGEYSVTGELSHSERVMEMLEELFAKHSFEVKDIDLFVSGKGPGSFTGLRIGITIIKTLAQALKKEGMGISTLAALAHGYPGEKLIVPILDARRERVYTGAYLWEDGELKNIIPDTVISWKDWVKELDGRRATILGPGISTFEEEIKKESFLEIAPSSFHQVRASQLCFLGLRDYEKGIRQNLYEITPNYVKKSQAEREWEGRHHG